MVVLAISLTFQHLSVLVVCGRNLPRQWHNQITTLVEALKKFPLIPTPTHQ